MIIDGHWLTKGRDFDVRLYLNKGGDYYGSAELVSDPMFFTFGDLQSLVNEFYMDARELLPSYGDEAGLREKIWEGSIVNPHITIYFNPRTSIKVTAGIQLFNTEQHPL